MFVRTHSAALLFCGLLALVSMPFGYSQADAAQPRENIDVCKVNGKAITEAEIMDEIDRFMTTKGGQIPPQLKQNAYVIFYEESVKRLTQMTLLEQKANELKIEAPQEEVDEFIDSIKEQAKTEDAFQAMLAQRGATEEELRKDYAQQLVYQKVLESEVKEPAEPTDEACKEFYDSNSQYFQTPEQVQASHILLMADEKATDEDRAKAKEQLTDIRKKIESNEIAFADAAKEFSKCPSAPQGGDLGWFGRGQMVKPFEESAFGMKEGEVSQIVETQFGYHLIQLNGKREEGVTPIDEVKPQISAHLKNTEMQANVQSYIESLEKDAKVETVMSDDDWKKRHAAKADPNASSSPTIQLSPDELK
ncbi:MAG: peptidylprolyl isomerase [Candidatus Hinthialibacter antarcticus]|nr:peptidylprolyl isomerase [Candidatus Hinthialibacter antarcticus]